MTTRHDARRRGRQAGRQPRYAVARVTLSRIVNGHAPVTVSMALKLEAQGWAAADVWLHYQTRYDLAQARERLHQPPAAFS